MKNDLYYEINLLDMDKMEWIPLMFNGKRMTFSNKITLMKAIKNNMGTSQQILFAGWFLEMIDGSEHQIDWFEKNHDRLLAKNKLCRETQNKYDDRIAEEQPKIKTKRR